MRSHAHACEDSTPGVTCCKEKPPRRTASGAVFMFNYGFLLGLLFAPAAAARQPACDVDPGEVEHDHGCGNTERNLCDVQPG